MRSGQPEAQKGNGQPEAQRDGGRSEPQREEGRPGPDTAAYAVIKRYLAGLIPELNLRLLCDMETGVYGFPGKILWVENITAYRIEEKAAACGDIENDCRAEKLPEEREVFEEESFAGRIKYRLKQLKNNWMNLWKKKGR